MKAPCALKGGTSTIDDVAAGRPSVLRDGSGKRAWIARDGFFNVKKCESVWICDAGG